MMVGDIPIEEQASEKAQEVALLYDDKGWVDRRDYTWLLYARAGMSDLELEDLRDQIIDTIQNWKRTHGLDDNLYALIADLARAGVIWKPVPTQGLETETLWLWKEMGFDAIRTEALRAGGLALKEEAVAIQERLSELDKIAELPKAIVMGTAAVALKKAKPLLAKYLDERNKTVQFIYDNYRQMSTGLKAEADEAIRKIRNDDATISGALAKVGMRMADFGESLPAQTLAAITAATAIVTITIVIGAVTVFVTAAIIWHLQTRRELGRKLLAALEVLQDQSLAAVDAERARQIAELPPGLSDEARRSKIAAIDVWAADQRANATATYAEQLKAAAAVIEPPLIKPWMWWAGGLASLPLGIWGIQRLVRKPGELPAGVTPEQAEVLKEEKRKAERATKERSRRRWMKIKPWLWALGTTSVVGLIFWIARKTIPPAPPAARLPNPESSAPPALPAPESTS